MFDVRKVKHYSREIGYQATIKCFEVVDSEDTAVAYLAALAGGKFLYITPAAIE